MIKLGTKAFDSVTGFEGIVAARAEYLHSTSRVMLESVDSTGRPIEWWYDEERVVELTEHENTTTE